MANINNKMMINKVIKRNGKRVDFDGTKIALAIKKGFDSVTIDGVNTKYSQEDVNKIYESILENISKLQTEKIKIEEIQDMIEDELKRQNYYDVYESFSSYREKRAQSRKLFFDEKRQHKFLKALENLGLKTSKEEENVKIQKNTTAMKMLLQYGGTISGEFAKAYLMKKKFEEAHENGDIYIHNLNFFPMGTTTCCQIDLNKLFKDGFSTGNGFIREPNDISYMAPGILKTFKKQFKQIVYDYLELTDFDKFIAINGIEREIEKISTIDFDVSIFYKYCRESQELKRMFNISYKKALEKTNKITYQSMEAFIHNLNTVNSRIGGQAPLSSICFGTDTSPEGRMVCINFLEAMEAGIGNHETAKFPISIFKISYLNFTLQYYCWFYLGYLIFSYEKKLQKVPLIKLLLLTLLFTILTIIFRYNILLINNFFKYISGICWVLLIYKLVSKIKTNKIIEYVSCNSFGIYLFHSPLVYITFSKIIFIN